MARTLGVGVSASGSHRGVSDFLRSGDILIVLDNAETFLDCKATEEIPRINRAITEFADHPSVTILITSRTRKLPHGLVYELREVPPLDKEPAIQTFMKVYKHDISRSLSILEQILDSVAYHPLSINLLAQAGEENQWSIEELLAHWSIQRTELLCTGHGKDDNLGKSVELSLTSPSVKALGDDVRGILCIIAFLPQGVLRENIEELFPTVRGIEQIISILLKQSLLLCDNGFVTMLAPIRLYLCDGSPQLDLLPTVREYYYRQFSLDPSTVVAREDANIESLIAHDFSSLSADDELEAVASACEAFIRTLCLSTCRSTSLRSVIDGLDTSLSPTRKILKLRCYTALSVLANRQSDFGTALQLERLKYNLAVELGRKKAAFEATCWSAVHYRVLGQYSTAQTVLDEAIASPDWATADEKTRARFLLTRAYMKQCNDIQLSGAGFARMFDESRRLFEAAGNVQGTDLATAEGNFSSGLIAGDWTSARSSLEASIGAILKTDPGRPSLGFFFYYLAAVALIEGKMDEARQSLSTAQRHFVLLGSAGKAQGALLTQAMIMLAEGNLEEARKHVRKVMKDTTSLGQAAGQLELLSGYASGLIELISGQLPEARQLFDKTKQFAENQGEFRLRAMCTRALGEVAFLEEDLLRARTHFEDTRSICASAGIVPELLYRQSRHIIYNKALPDACKGWTLFLENRFPVV